MIKIRPLSEKEILSEVVSIVTHYLPEVTIYLFGSRAWGRARENSDFDIALEWKEKIPLSTLSKIRERLEEIPTLKSFDLVDIRRCSDDLAILIKEKGIILHDSKRT